jgi:hypothetical protein
VVFFLASTALEDAAMHRNAPLLFAGSAVIVLAQLLTLVGVFLRIV